MYVYKFQCPSDVSKIGEPLLYSLAFEDIIHYNIEVQANDGLSARIMALFYLKCERCNELLEPKNCCPGPNILEIKERISDNKSNDKDENLTIA